MIGLIVVSHGDLASSFVSAAELIIGPQKYLKAISVQSTASNMDEHRASILEAIKEVDTGKGVILLTDLFGGTISNLFISVNNTMQKFLSCTMSKSVFWISCLICCL